MLRSTHSILILCFLCVFSFNGIAQEDQQHIRDSLVKQLNVVEVDSEKIKIWLDISSSFDDKDTCSKLNYVNKALSLSEKNQWTRGIVLCHKKRGAFYRSADEGAKAIDAYRQCASNALLISDSSNIAESYSFIGTIYQFDNRFDSSLTYFKLSLKYRTDPRNQIGLLANLAVVYNLLGDYPRALENYIQATKINQKIISNVGNNKDDSLTQAGLLFNISEIYTEMKQFDKAHDNYQEVLKMSLKLNDTLFEMISFKGIANTLKEKGRPLVAIEYFQKALDLSRGGNDFMNQSSIMNDLGSVYLSLGKNDQALFYSLRAKQIAELRGYESVLTKIYNNLGNIYHLQKAHSSAIEYLKKAVDISKKIGIIADQRDAWQILSFVYEEVNQPKEALNAYQQFITLRDSIINVDKVRQITSADMQFKFESQQLADSLRQALAFNLKIQRQRVYTVSSIIGLLSVLMLAFFILRSYRKAKKANNIIRKANETIHAEKQVSENLLLNILPKYVAEELKHHGKVQAKLFEHVTVLFTDFVNFTKTSERLSPEELIAELDTCFKVFDEIAERYKIEKIKTVGDAYLAVSGLPIEEPNHAIEIVKAAIDMRDFMQNRRTHLGNATFEIRVGVHTGKVIAGIVGVKKFSYDVWGDTVNTAARMEQCSESGKINISKATYELVKDHFTCEYRGEIDAKNKGKMSMYFVEPNQLL